MVSISAEKQLKSDPFLPQKICSKCGIFDRVNSVLFISLSLRPRAKLKIEADLGRPRAASSSLPEQKKFSVFCRARELYRRRWPLCLPLPLISFAVVVGVVRVATSFGRGREFTMTDVAGAAELMPN